MKLYTYVHVWTLVWKPRSTLFSSSDKKKCREKVGESENSRKTVGKQSDEIRKLVSRKTVGKLSDDISESEKCRKTVGWKLASRKKVGEAKVGWILSENCRNSLYTPHPQYNVLDNAHCAKQQRWYLSKGNSGLFCGSSKWAMSFPLMGSCQGPAPDP